MKNPSFICTILNFILTLPFLLVSVHALLTLTPRKSAIYASLTNGISQTIFGAVLIPAVGKRWSAAIVLVQLSLFIQASMVVSRIPYSPCGSLTFCAGF